MTQFQQSRLFSELEKIGEQRTIRPNEVLIDFEQRADRLFVVQRGGLVLLFINPNTGAERAINFFIPDFHPVATVAESFALNTTSKYRLVSFTRSQLIEVKKTELEEHIKTIGLYEEFREYGTRSLIEKNELRAMLISLSAEEMLQYVYKSIPQILREVPSKYVADFLGITPQWLSKLKHKL